MLATNKNLASMNVQMIWSELRGEDYSKTVSVYPNPFVESIAFEFYSDANGTADISITDQLGRKIHQWNVDTQEGSNKITWDGKDISGAALSTGVYIVNLTTSIGVTKVKVVKTM